MENKYSFAPRSSEQELHLSNLETKVQVELWRALTDIVDQVAVNPKLVDLTPSELAEVIFKSVQLDPTDQKNFEIRIDRIRRKKE